MPTVHFLNGGGNWGGGWPVPVHGEGRGGGGGLCNEVQIWTCWGRAASLYGEVQSIMEHTHDWKHCLPAISLAGGNNGFFSL